MIEDGTDPIVDVYNIFFIKSFIIFCHCFYLLFTRIRVDNLSPQQPYFPKE